MNDSLLFTQAFSEDAQEILELQRLAYQGEPTGDFSRLIPPLQEMIGNVRAAIEDRYVLKVVVDGRILGSARGKLVDGTCYIERVIVHPGMQNRGLGKRMMAHLEAQFTDARRFELFTGNTNRRNLYFYAQLGYAPFKTVPRTGTAPLVYLEKIQTPNLCETEPAGPVVATEEVA